MYKIEAKRFKTEYWWSSMITQERAYISPIWHTLKGQYASFTAL